MSKAEQPHFLKTDKRLLGVWKTDKKRTFADWSWKKTTTLKKRERFKLLFGKLEITYTRTKISSKLGYKKWEQAQRYAIVATDETSAAIIQFGKLEIKNRRQYDPENLKMVEQLFPSKPKVSHIHFDKKHYWISLGSGKNREFFRKVSDGK